MNRGGGQHGSKEPGKRLQLVVRRLPLRWLTFTLAALLAVLLLAPDLTMRHPSATFTRWSDPATAAPGEYIVHFAPGLPRDQRDAMLAASGATLKQELAIPDYVTVEAAPGREADTGRALARLGAVQSVDESGIRQPLFVPNDEFFSSQWNLEMIQMERAWDVTHGAGVTVAVVDTGVAYENYDDGVTQYGQAPDLAGTSFIAPHDFYDNDAHPNDDLGHGTHITGTIAGTTDNRIGVAGIAYGATVMPIKVCGKDPTPTLAYGCPPADIASGIFQAVNSGAQVINLSLGSPGEVTSAERDALKYAQDAGVVVVAAAGNGGRSVLDYPAAVPSVIAVGAAGPDGTRALYSNYGTGEGDHGLDLLAPGGDPAKSEYILQNSYQDFCNQKAVGDHTAFWYCLKYGTSMATAHVSGVAALLLSNFPTLTPANVREILHCSAKDVGPPGPDSESGWGLLQAFDALRDRDQDGIPDCIDPDVGGTPENTCLPPTPSPTPGPPQSGTPALTQTQVIEPIPMATRTGRHTPTPTPLTSDVRTPRLPLGAPLSDTPTPTPSATVSATPSPTPSASDTPTPTLTESPTPSSSATPVPSDTFSPTATPSGTPPPPPTPTSTPLPTLPPPTATPEPSATPTATPGVDPHDYACGDVNCDGQVNSVDALFILRWVAQAEPYARCLGNAHVDCDGDVDSVDALMVLRWVAGLPLSLPVGCPGPG